MASESFTKRVATNMSYLKIGRIEPEIDLNYAFTQMANILLGM
jgi:hypothetical protein